jgi:hypothetical protein
MQYIVYARGAGLSSKAGTAIVAIERHQPARTPTFSANCPSLRAGNARPIAQLRD